MFKLFASVVVALAASPFLHATILRFDFQQADYTPIAANYDSNLGAVDSAGADEGTGWTPHVVLSYRALDQFMNLLAPSEVSPDPTRAYYWSVGAGSLTNVIYPEDAHARFLEIAFTPLYGSMVRLLSVDLGAFTQLPDQSVTVLDANLNTVFSTSTNVPTTGSTTINFNGLTSIDTLYLRVGLASAANEGSYFVGVDNLSFDQNASMDEAVPEPSSIVLAGIGLAIVAFRRRSLRSNGLS